MFHYYAIIYKIDKYIIKKIMFVEKNNVKR